MTQNDWQRQWNQDEASAQQAKADGLYPTMPTMVNLTMTAWDLGQLAIIMADAEGVTLSNPALASLLKNDTFRAAYNDRRKQMGF